MIFLWSLALSGCGGGNSSAPPPPAPTITSVTVSPGSASLFVKAPQQFSANVKGTGSFNPGVTWMVNGLAGGNSTVGTINSSGLYTAPQVVPTPNNVTVTAQSVEDNTKSGTSTLTINPENVQISISPGSGTVQLNANLQFSATVTGAANTGIFWSVNNFVGGQPNLGFIDGNGKYTAPSNLPPSKQVTITATSQEDTSKSSSATVTITASAGGITVTISPQSPSVLFDGSQNIQFTASVSGTPNTGVTWSVDSFSYPAIGQISADGLFVPFGFNCTNVPPVGAIRAVSVANPGAQAISLVNLVPPAPVITGLSPQPADAETQVQLAGTFAIGASLAALYTASTGVTVPGAITTASSTSASGPVPLGASSGTLSIQQSCTSGITGFQYPNQESNSLSFQRLPRLRVRANSQVLTPGESTQMLVAFLGDPTPRPITWSALFGTVSSGGLFTAGASNWDKVTGCITGTQQCDFFAFSVVPTRIEPTVPVIPMSGSLQLSEVQGGSTLSPAWTINAGGGTLSVNGLYSADSVLQDAGAIPITATATAGNATNAVGVTGGFPGMVNRIIDYPDISANATGTTTLPKRVTVDGNKVYVFADNLPFGVANGHYKWIDVYDATDPAHPMWTGAAEGFDHDLNINPMQTFASGGFLWRVTAAESASPAGSLTTDVAFFDSSNGKPVLKQFFSTPKLWVYSFYKGLFIGVPNSFTPTGQSLWQQVTMQIFDGRSGTIFPSQKILPNPNPPTPISILGIFNTDTRVFLLYQQQQSDNSLPFLLSTYDITTSPPTLLQSIPAQNGSIFLPGVEVPGVFGKFLFAGGGIYDISSGLPVFLAPMQDGAPTDMNGSLGLVGAGTYSVVDFSNPANPKTEGDLFNGDDLFNGIPQFVGNHIYRPSSGLEIFDVSASVGGQLRKAPINGSGTIGIINSLLVNSSDLYVAENTDVGTFVSTFDLSQTPPQKINSFPLNSLTGETPLALIISSHFLFVGTSTELLVLDVSNPSSPVKVASLPLPVSSLALVGNLLYAGTIDDHLAVINVANPSAPVVGTSIGIAGFPVRIQASGSLLFIAADTAGLLTYSVTNPSTPTLLSQFQPSSAVEDVTVDGTLALLAATDGGFVLANMTNPAAPVLAGQVPLPALSCYADLSPSDGQPGLVSISVSNGIAYLGSANMFGRVFGFDYREPSHPRVVSTAAYGDAIIESVFAITFDRSNLFAAGDLFSDRIFEADATQPRNFIRQMCLPAPFGANATTAFPELKTRSAVLSDWNPKMAHLRASAKPTN